MVEKENVLNDHKLHKGKIEIVGRVEIETKDQLSTYYTPGVAYACMDIKENKDRVYDYTMKGRSVAIVTDGTRILGLGKIGPEAGLPVMEGKALLFKKYGGVDAFPICLNTTDEDKIVDTIRNISPTFGAINVEDIETPKCFKIADRLRNELDIPVFHDDRNGVAVVTLAGIYNALKLAGKKIGDVKVVVNGAGAAGIGIAELLSYAGARSICVVDTTGAIYEGRQENMNYMKEKIAKITNLEKRHGNLTEMVVGADILIGASTRGAFSKEMIQSMNEKPIVFALANPEPEIPYNDALEAGAFIVATGRSDTPNQVNNLFAFPGIVRGLLEVRAKGFDEFMMAQAAKVLSKSVGKKLAKDYIMPDPTDKNLIVKLAADVAAEITSAAMQHGFARVNVEKEKVAREVKESLKSYRKMEKFIGKR